MNKILTSVAMIAGSAVTTIGLMATPVFAASVDPSVSAAVTAGFTDTTTLLTTVLIPALLGLVVIGIAVRVGVKYLRRGASS